MSDYQNEAGRIAIRRSYRDNETEKHPAMTALDQSRGKGNSPDIALQPDLSAERALYRSGGDRSANRATVSHSALLQLQRIHGNQYISRMLQAAELENGESSVTQDVEHTIERSRGGGQALDGGVRHSMGKAMNADFSGVRVHTDSEADGLNRSLQARAFTTGRDVYFRQGEYNPGSSSGRELLAHELTHVVQQGGSAVQSKNEDENTESTCSGCAAKSAVGALQAKLTLGAPNDIYEQEADSVANAYINWERQPVARDNAGSQIRRQEGEEDKKEQMMQTKPDASHLLRQPEGEKEKEPLQARLDNNYLRRQPEEKEEEPMQAKLEAGLVQQQPEEEQEEPVQAKAAADGLQREHAKQKGIIQQNCGMVLGWHEHSISLNATVPSDSKVVQKLQQSANGENENKLDQTVRAGSEPRLSADARLQFRPTRVPAPFIGGSAFNDSMVTFTPRGVVFIGGNESSSTDFPSGGQSTVQIRAGTSGTVQLHVNVSVFEDNILINQRWSQSFYVSWTVSAADDGTLTINSAPSPTVNPRDGSNSQSALESINATKGANYVQVSPRIVGASTTGGISLGVGMGTNYPGSFMQRSFRLNVEATDIRSPEVDVTIGPIRIIRTHEVMFERPLQSEVSRQQEAQLISWYESLNAAARQQIQSGQESISLVGHASTTGGPRRNRELSNSRMEAVRRILRHYSGSDTRFSARSVGDYNATTGDEVESAEERKVVVTVREQISEGDEGGE